MSQDPPSLRAFGEADGDLADLAGRTVAVIGYGNQGRAQACNLRDSGIDKILVGTLRDDSWAQAEADGFPVRPTPEAAQEGDVLLLLVPDEDLPEVFAEEIAPQLQPNDALVVASGYNLAYGGITPPENVDVLMLAPRMIGRQLRQRYERGEGFYSYVSVEQDASGRAWPLLLALAKGIGTLSPGGGALELSAKNEAVLDLFHEQGFGALLGMAIYQSLEVGLQAGIPAEAMVLDFYLSGEMAETFQSMADLGFVDSARLHSRTSQYGGLMRSLELDREPIRRHLQHVMDELQNGAFAERWSAERTSGYENFSRLQELGRGANPFAAIEARLRDLLREAQGHGA